MISEGQQNKVISDKKIERCCYDFDSIVICTYNSGSTWILCNLHDQDEAFPTGRTSRMRIQQ